MGKLIARELDELKWGLAGCLLFIGISAPAFHQFYKKSWQAFRCLKPDDQEPINDQSAKKYRQGWKRVHFPRSAKRVRTVRADMDRDMEVHSGANGPKAEAARPFGRRPLQRRGMVCTL